MLAQTVMQTIQDLKLQGYSKAEIPKYFEARGEKPPSRPTISKYYDMDVLPEKPGAKYEKEKVFDVEPFKQTIIQILETNDDKVYISSIYDVLEEKFIENGEYEKLPGNEQTLRNYVHYLKESGTVNTEESHKRTYDYVFDTPPGEQMLIDFGEETISSSQNKSIHFICLLLRYSRYLIVYAQDHKFNSYDACAAIYRAFSRLGGRPCKLVIDQDAVFVASETYGEVIKTATFDNFCREQDLTLFVCNKADPESKGPIENAVGFVKKNFFSARKITCVDDVWRSLPGWLERKNRRIHKAILRVPVEVFNSYEKGALRPLVGSVFEESPNSYRTTTLRGMPYIQFESSKYSVPYIYAYKTVRYKAAGGQLFIYDENYHWIATHKINECKGSTNQLSEHRKPANEDWLAIVERLRQKWNCVDFQHFVNGVKKENPRHLTKQFGAIEQFLDAEDPDRGFVADVLAECCEHFRYQFTQFRDVYNTMKANRSVGLPESQITASTGAVTYTDMSVYAEVFAARSGGQEASK